MTGGLCHQQEPGLHISGGMPACPALHGVSFASSISDVPQSKILFVLDWGFWSESEACVPQGLWLVQ